MKTCSKCGELKDDTKFRLTRNVCKNCAKEYQKKWKESNPTWFKEYKKKWYKDNKKEVIEKQKKYSENNPDLIRAKNREWKESNPERQLYYCQKYRLKKQIGEIPPPELVEVKLLINKIKRL